MNQTLEVLMSDQPHDKRPELLNQLELEEQLTLDDLYKNGTRKGWEEKARSHHWMPTQVHQVWDWYVANISPGVLDRADEAQLRDLRRAFDESDGQEWDESNHQ